MSEQFDEINQVGTIYTNGISVISRDNDGLFMIAVSEAWDDSTPRRLIHLTCGHGDGVSEYSLSPDKAEALGLILCAAARSMKEMIAHLERSERETDEMFEAQQEGENDE